jgi:hypothetical protein
VAARGPVDAKLTVDVSKVLVDQFTSWQGPVGRSVSRLASSTVAQQKLLAPKRTGALAKSIKWTRGVSPRGITFTTGSSKPYAGFMEKGTRPHPIRPKRAGGFLVFFWPKVGRTVFLRSVNHPGTPAYHYLSKGYRKALAVWKRTG